MLNLMEKNEWVFALRERPVNHKYLKYYGNWWPGGTRSQGIHSQGICIVILEYSSFSIEKFILTKMPS